jgi:hypothetical protein
MNLHVHCLPRALLSTPFCRRKLGVIALLPDTASFSLPGIYSLLGYAPLLPGSHFSLLGFWFPYLKPYQFWR